MNDKGKKRAILKRIDTMPEDSAFTATDFSDVADSDSIRQTLKELASQGVIVRASRGVYYKPRFSTFLGQAMPPDVDAVADAVARARGWTIAPSGDHALNKLGLDTQVPAVYSFISTGPYAELQAGSHDIRFKHSTNKNVVGMSPTTALVVQALKALGKERATANVAMRISRQLTSEEKQALLDESERTTAWIRRVIQDIAKGEAE